MSSAPLLLAPSAAFGQTARITEELRTLNTYSFADANPVPILTRDPRLYPYHSFEGYSATAEPRPWKVVKLENDYIEVFVLPEVGGKVWGAVAKETGHEFIYRNEVMKFRNISLRGPWTSGGIEFNFGVIGHTPATATPVDYLLRENEDGSVSCWVGSMDLPSRTHWRVEVRLPPDRAYFETNVLWYNPTPLEQSYYNWMTAAAFARDDLEMSMPGDAYLRHSGQVEEWPVDEEGRYLPLYSNNTFAGHKSYHVVGELHDFFGGYYHDDDYGFGHWSRHEEMPGQKLWLWALSREGGVWEDLLTDTDGQYVEFQAGRFLVQYSPGSHVNPITQAAFEPISASRWSETWFPVEGIGGLTEASRDGAMHVSLQGDRLIVAVNAFMDVVDTVEVWSSGRLVATEPVSLTTLEPYRTTVLVTPGESFRVHLPLLGLEYNFDPSDRRLSRPFSVDPEAWASIPEVDRTVFEARELLKERRHAQARGLFEAALRTEPWNREALLGLADLSYRAGLYEEGLGHVYRALQLDAYDAEANFLAGILYRAVRRTADAHDALGWAARSTAYRSAAYVQLAELMIDEGELQEAARYARLALDYDRYSMPGWRALAVIGRMTGDQALSGEALAELQALDPLHHFAAAEAYLAALTPVSARALAAALGGEYPAQTLLELAVAYTNLGLGGDALTLLGINVGDDSDQGSMPRTGVEAGQAPGLGGPDDRGPVHRAWRAWLDRDPSLLAEAGDPDFHFPYRPETLPVLEWAAEQSDAWIWRYLLALNLWAVDREEEAAVHLAALGDEPDFGPLYVARAHLLMRLRGVDPTPDLRRAVALDPESRILHTHLIRHLQDERRWEEALAALGTARERFPHDFNLDLLQVRALIHVGRAREATAILAATHVLPSENARESHRLYEQAHTLVALGAIEAGEHESAREQLLTALEWPESLGQGRPYQPEERLVRFLLGRVESRLGNDDAARRAYRTVVDATGDLSPLARLRSLDALRAPSGGLSAFDRLNLLVVPALHALGRSAELEGISWASGSPRDLADRLATEIPGLFADLEGRMILRALSLGE